MAAIAALVIRRQVLAMTEAQATARYSVARVVILRLNKLTS